MVHPLYLTIDLVLIILLSNILINECRSKSPRTKQMKAFILLIKWVMFFCLQDAVWGLTASGLLDIEGSLFVSSTVFHASSVFTTLFWLYYILSYLGNHIQHHRALLTINAVVIAVQLGLLIANIFNNCIFEVVEGEYVTGPLRPLAFLNQYVIYLTTSVITGGYILLHRKNLNEKYVSVFFFSLAPVLTGIFQLLYPEAPFHAIGYFLGCFIIHIFVVSKDRDELFQLQYLKEKEQQSSMARTDRLTGLRNRRAYEEDLGDPAIAGHDNLVYIALDINGLKEANDTHGHDAGDQLIKGTAWCMEQSLGRYGKLYRIGGDEYAAIFYAEEKELGRIERELTESVKKWNTQNENIVLSISYGMAMQSKTKELSIRAIASMADREMYKAKEAHYNQMGVDRRSQSNAFRALCSSYKKILKINLTSDSYRIIKMDNAEKQEKMGFSDSISSWLYDFGASGQVHPDDLADYQARTQADYMRNFFEEKGNNLNIFYRRKYGDTYRLTKMELIAAEDFTPENKSLYLFVKDIDK